MTLATIHLISERRRREAAEACWKAPASAFVEIHDARRTIPQNRKFHAMCTDVARQMTWMDAMGRPIKMTPENWKRFFLAAWKRETLIVPNEDGTGFYDLGVRSSRLSKKDFIDLIEFVLAFGAQRNIEFSDDPQTAREEETSDA
jgi:hypothetical protein